MGYMPKDVHPMLMLGCSSIGDAWTSFAQNIKEVEAYEGKDVIFKFGQAAMPFTAEGFLMSFSLPNLHFHATTAYDILRTKGVPLGKRDYLGPLRLKR